MGLWDPTGILGQNVATASGRIVLDTSGIVAARGVIDAESRKIGEAMQRNIGGGAQNAAQMATRSLEQLGVSMRNLGAGVGLVFSGIVAGGTQAAMSLRQTNAMFQVLTGSEAEATRQMDALRALADRTRQPFTQILQGATSLAPALRGTNVELADVVSMAQRLAILDPAQGITGASLAIREFLAGDYLSLARRFELSRAQLQEIVREANGDAGQMVSALGQMIDATGLTEEALAQMGAAGGSAFAMLRSEVEQAAADAFEPFVANVLLPAVQGLSDFLRTVREMNPEVLQIAGGFAFVVASGGAFLAFLGQAISMVNTLNASLRTLGVSGGLGTLARAVGVGAAAVGGVALGQAVGQQIQPENQALQGGLGDVTARAATTLATWLAGVVGRVGEALTELHFVFRAVGLQIQDAFGQALEAVGRFVLAIASLLSRFGIDATGTMQAGLDALTRGSEARTAARAGAGALAAEREAALAGAQAQTQAMMGSVAEFFVSLFGGADALARFRGEVAETGEAADAATEELQQFVPTVEDFTDEQVAAWQDFQGDLAQITEDAAAARLKVEADAVAAREKLLASWRLQDARAAQDEVIAARRRAEARAAAAEALEKQWNDRKADLIDKAKAQELADLAAHEQRMAELQRTLRENMISAASRLDAVALWNAIRSYNEQAAREKENAAARQEQRAAQLAEQLAAEDAAHAARMAQQQQQYAEEDRIRLEDQRLRMQRMLEDRELQMQAADAQLADRIAQINAQAAAERAARQAAFIEQFNSLATHEGQMLGIQIQGQAEAEAALREWWFRMRETFATPNAALQGAASQVQTRGGMGLAAPRREYQSGGDVWETGLAGLHAGEHVLNPATASLLRMLLGGAITPARLVGAVAGGGTINNSRSVNVGNIYGADTGSAGSFKQAVREVFSELLDEWG